MAPKGRTRSKTSPVGGVAEDSAAAVASVLSGSRPLYEVLGIAPSATQADVQKAFKLRALRVHPDKNPGDEGAKAAFQELQRAYEVLRDPERRKRYDELGEESGDDSLVSEVVRWFRTRYRPVTVEEIAEFTRNYRGSAEERADVAAFVRERNGNVSRLLECVVCAEPEDVGRFEALLTELLGTGEVPKACGSEVRRTLPLLRKNAATLSRRNARERRELERGGGGGAVGGGPAASLAALAEAIRGRQQVRWAASITDRLEAKYCGSGAVPAARSRKRPAASEDAGALADEAPRKEGKGSSVFAAAWCFPGPWRARTHATKLSRGPRALDWTVGGGPSLSSALPQSPLEAQLRSPGACFAKAAKWH
eukprot:CAMPEP_0176089348 /NCGR_PEP_ID=MMETSP0120_2-20121206/44747_1 /TAXON_ID=160619 /ORGANISM="Kryptoperidinium foliaceum, Strain CCMP 1326" /LENGTH=365 /DNA_ID=CAMNT_0017423227 /DNA_START=17 /DNA_END=1112 /DNA_ORIENTATION=+